MQLLILIATICSFLTLSAARAAEADVFVGDFLDECFGSSGLTKLFDDHVGLGSGGTLRDAYVPPALFNDTIQIEVFDDYAIWTWEFQEGVRLSGMKLHSARLIAGFENGIHSRALLFAESRQNVEQRLFSRIQKANESFRTTSDLFDDLGIPWIYVSSDGNTTAVECDLNN